MKASGTTINKQITTITRCARDLERSVRRLMPLLAALNGSAPTAGRARRSLTRSPKRRAELKLQGSYLGYMRQLKVRQKAQVREGRREASRPRSGWRSGWREAETRDEG